MHRNILRFALVLAGSCSAAVLLAAQKDWVTLENCQLIENASNDGDSFHIRTNGTEYLVRLYLVDAPETKSTEPERLIEQAGYFGISVPQVIEIGAKAKTFVQTKLTEPFTVVTKMASGLGRSNIQRFYGFVQTKDGDIGELLVANGLARIHGTRAAPPGAKNATDEIQKLQDLEQQAKQAKRGGWNGNTGKDATTASVASVTPAPVEQLPKTTVPVAAPKTATAALVATGKSAPGLAGKLDINTASKEELEKIPGVGSALSERIIAARPFRSADDLKSVKGVGKGKRYDEIRAFFQ